MKKLPISLLGLLALATASQAQTTVSSDPVGFNSITALGNSDTRFSVPLHRMHAYQGAVASVSGNVITVSGTPFTASQYVYAAGTQTDTFYLEFATGAKTGKFYTISANTASTLTLDPLDLVGDSLNAVVAGDSFRLIPYWTLSTIFPNQAGVAGTNQISGDSPVTDILIPDTKTAGTDLATSTGYFYYTGTSFGGAGWREIGGSPTAKKNDVPISPDSFVIIRQDGVGTNSLVVATGAVPTNARKYVLGTIEANTDQDNAIAVDVPVGITLTQSNLFQSGAFAGTSLISGDNGDQLLVFDNSEVNFDKASSITYFYYTGTSFGGAGWRILGGSPTAKQDTTVVFQPGNGYVVRKVGTSVPQTFVWNMNLPY